MSCLTVREFGTLGSWDNTIADDPEGYSAACVHVLDGGSVHRCYVDVAGGFISVCRDCAENLEAEDKTGKYCKLPEGEFPIHTRTSWCEHVFPKQRPAFVFWGPYSKTVYFMCEECADSFENEAPEAPEMARLRLTIWRPDKD